MEWIMQNLLFCVGIAGVVVFLLVGLIAATVLKKRRTRIERAVQEEYEPFRE